MKKKPIRGSLSYAFAGLQSDSKGLYTYEEDNMSKPRKTVIPYSEEALEYFQSENDKTEFTTEAIGGDYLSYILGDEIDTSGDSFDDVMEYDESDDEWYMD